MLLGIVHAGEFHNQQITPEVCRRSDADDLRSTSYRRRCHRSGYDRTAAGIWGADLPPLKRSSRSTVFTKED
jgi:hypothetical protein